MTGNPYRAAEETATIIVVIAAHAALCYTVYRNPDALFSAGAPMSTVTTPSSRSTVCDHLFPRWQAFTADDYSEIAREQRDRADYLEEIGEYYAATEPAEIARWAEHNAAYALQVCGGAPCAR